MRKFLLSLTLAAAIATPAHADVLGDVGQHLGQVSDKLDQVSAHVGKKLDENLNALWSFLGSSQIETGALAPVDVTPGARLPRDMTERTMPGLRLAVAELTAPQLPARREPPKPTYERASKFLQCVEYARSLTGLNIFGDARHWWERARNLYARASHPAEEAVMVFTGTKRLAHGHLAVVSHIVSPREIRVEQANWLNRGEIDRATPVLDVSEKNDWSKVRVWDMPSGQFGSRVYAISGFILKPAQQIARND
jgi:surface antigen